MDTRSMGVKQIPYKVEATQKHQIKLSLQSEHIRSNITIKQILSIFQKSCYNDIYDNDMDCLSLSKAFKRYFQIRKKLFLSRAESSARFAEMTIHRQTFNRVEEIDVTAQNGAINLVRVGYLPWASMTRRFRSPSLRVIIK